MTQLLLAQGSPGSAAGGREVPRSPRSRSPGRHSPTRGAGGGGGTLASLPFVPPAARRKAARGDGPRREGERAATPGRAAERSLGEQLKKGRRCRGAKESPPPGAAPARACAERRQL